MEGEQEEPDDDIKGQYGSCPAHSAVLWERSIQQSIFVDLSEDESLHLSDLESSFVLSISHAESAASEASVHLRGSAELSALDDSSSECISVSGQERIVEGKTRSSMSRVPKAQPSSIEGELPSSQGLDPGQNTSDEEQEDLPYDGDLGSPYFNCTANTEKSLSSDRGETPPTSPGVPGLPAVTKEGRVYPFSPIECSNMEPELKPQEDDNHKGDNIHNASKPTDLPPLFSSPVNGFHHPEIAQLLLQHFSQEELLCSGRLIEAETLPEVSLLESMDETVLSSVLRHNVNHGGGEGSFIGNRENKHSLCESYGTRTANPSPTPSEILPESEEKKDKSSNVASSASDSNIISSISKQESGDANDSDLSNREDTKEDDLAGNVPLMRTRSFSDIKYGQGQVHYPLPDFTKVAPKVKIPKTPSGPAWPVAQSPRTIHRAQSSPGILDVISRVLEDTVLPSEKLYVFNDQDEQPTAPALVHHLQAEYDKLLTKYAEAENLIDQMRLGNQAQVSPDFLLEFDCCDGKDDAREGGPLGSLAPPPPPATEKLVKEPAHQSTVDQLSPASSGQSNQEAPSDGERMTAELRDIISQFMKQVVEFKNCVNNMSVSTEEQQMMLRSMMEAQDQLERRYIGTKEQHRALEMQNYMGLGRNTGTFDHDRLLEGDIFRIGMHLEDIKEMTDRNLCDHLSPPRSSSTPMHPAPITPPPKAVNEGPSASFSTAGYELDRNEGEQEEVEKEVEEEMEEEEEEVKEASEAQGGFEIDQSSHLINSTGQTSCHPRSLQVSLERLDNAKAEDEDSGAEERNSSLLEEIVHDNILAFLEGTTDSISTPESTSGPDSECVFAGTSLAVELSCSSNALNTQSLSAPSLCNSSISHRSPETDSGFGSSDFSPPAAEPFQPKLLIESGHPQNDLLSSSGSEGSCSNLQTAIHSVSLIHQQRNLLPTHNQTQPNPAVELWVDSTIKEPTVSVHESNPYLAIQFQHLRSEPSLSPSMEAPERASHQHSCSCNSEAITALQSEVSRLKQDLEAGLVQLPQLAQKMDYLTSKYRLDRQDRRTKPRTHPKPTSNSMFKPRSRSDIQNSRYPSSSQMKVEDWISTDMDPSKSKGTDSGDTDASAILLQFQSTPLGSRRGTNSPQAFSEVQRGTPSKQLFHRGSEENCSVKPSAVSQSGLLKGNQPLPHAKVSHRTLRADIDRSKERVSPFSPLPLHKPLLQVNYGSSCSLPASYKVRESLLHLVSSYQKRSTQSDSALLPSNVFFQRTPSPGFAPSKLGSRAGRRRGNKEEEMRKTLDQAIEAARRMKRTTDRMAKSLSADLAKAQLYRRQRNMQPLGGRKHNDL